VRLAVARLEHGHRRLVGVQHVVLQECCRQRVDQRLQLRATFAHPLRQGRARDGQAGALEDAFLPVQRQVVEELGDQHLGQQPGRGMPLSMMCGATGACTSVWQCMQTHLPRTWRSTVNVPGA